MKKTLQGDYTLLPAMFSNGYHVPIIRHTLTRALPSIFSSVVEELKLAFEEKISLSSADPKGWLTVKGHDVSMDVICRASNRMFVGQSLCRNKEYMDVAHKYTIDVILGAHIISFFPSFLKP